jgi:hypothetical protein
MKPFIKVLVCMWAIDNDLLAACPMIPRRLSWLFDLIVITDAFLAAYQLVPYNLPLFALGVSLRTPWLEEVFSPSVWLVPFPSPLRKFTGAIESRILTSGSSWTWYIDHWSLPRDP